MSQSCSFQKLSTQRWVSILLCQSAGSCLNLCPKQASSHLSADQSKWHCQAHTGWMHKASKSDMSYCPCSTDFLSARAARGKITGLHSAWKSFIFHSSVFITPAFIWYNHSHHAKLTENWYCWFIPIAGRFKSSTTYNSRAVCNFCPQNFLERVVSCYLPPSCYSPPLSKCSVSS